MSADIGMLAEALSKAQGTMKAAKKDGVNPYFSSKYATMDAVWDTCREPLAANKLSVIQLLGNDGNDATLTTILAHASGQWVRSTIAVTPMRRKSKSEGGGFEDASDVQSIGGTLTYLRRYALAAIVGVVSDEDTDGEGGRKAAESGRADSENAGEKAAVEIPDKTDDLTKKALSRAIGFGKYKGKTLGSILMDEAEGATYLHWLADKAEDPKLRTAAAYLLKHRASL
jgi:hypothetical protein